VITAEELIHRKVMSQAETLEEWGGDALTRHYGYWQEFQSVVIS
jgi:hypothetical protein